MKRFWSVFAVSCLTAHTANAGSHTAQQLCNFARISAWKTYQNCVEKYVAIWSEGVSMVFINAPDTGFRRCRNSYFRKWTSFQSKAALTSTTCIGSRFTDNGNGTITDNLSELVWEKKTNQDGNANYTDPHDADNPYTWTTGSDNEDGALFTQFLNDPSTGLNTTGFAGSYGWRIPTITELQTLVLEIPCRNCDCQSIAPVCVDPIFLPSALGSWSATTYIDANSLAHDYAWDVDFFYGSPEGGLKAYPSGGFARAVRGGL
jgi:hypothetical protein